MVHLMKNKVRSRKPILKYKKNTLCKVKENNKKNALLLIPSNVFEIIIEFVQTKCPERILWYLHDKRPMHQ